MTFPADKYAALADQIEAILQDPEAEAQVKDERLRLAEGGKKLGISFEGPNDTLRRYGYMVFPPPILFSYNRIIILTAIGLALSTSSGLRWCPVWNIQCSGARTGKVVHQSRTRRENWGGPEAIGQVHCSPCGSIFLIMCRAAATLLSIPQLHRPARGKWLQG